MPGFLAQAFPAIASPSVPAFWRGVYAYAWFVGFAVAGTLYFVLTRALASPAGARVPAAGAREGAS